MNKTPFRKYMVFTIMILFIGTCFIPSIISDIGFNKNSYDIIKLPEPNFSDINLEISMCRRMSIRDFDEKSVTDQALSNILWAAYGYTSNNKRTIHSVNNQYSIIIYVIRKDGTFRYNPENHTLELFRKGDYTFIGQYDSAPIKIGLVWNEKISADENLAWTEIGMIGQNIYFEVNSLNLGTVTTGSEVNQLNLLILPINEKPLIIMPLGHPSINYDFSFNPIEMSNLPSIENNTITLEEAINNRLETNKWTNEKLSDYEQSQLIWASYGYSYLIDNLNDKRHRTVPSSHGTYPIIIYAINQTGVYKYLPNNHSINKIINDNRIYNISQSIYSEIKLSTAQFMLISFLDTNLVNPDYIQAWYYEAGAIAHNVFLESTSMNLSSNVIYKFDSELLLSSLEIESENNLLPLFLMPLGKTIENDAPDKPSKPTGEISGKTGIEYIYSSSTIDPNGDDVFYIFDYGNGVTSFWYGPFKSGEFCNASIIWFEDGDYEVRVKAQDIYGAESEWSDPLSITMPKNKSFNYIPKDSNLVDREVSFSTAVFI